MKYPSDFLEFCVSLGQTWTSSRKLILYLLWRSSKPLKAYELLDQLREIKSTVTPPTIYRVMDFLISKGVVHKVESIQSYTLCHKSLHQIREQAALLFVCVHCHNVKETFNSHFAEEVARLSQQASFTAEHTAMELKGTCEACLKN